MTSDTPRTDACPHCGDDDTHLIMSTVCVQRKARQKADAEVDRLRDLVNESIREKSSLSVCLVNCQESLRRAETNVKEIRAALDQMTEDAVNLKAEVEFWKAKAYEAEDREGKLEAEVERLKEQLSDSRDDLMRTQIEMQLEIDRGEAEVEKLEVEYWFMEEALTKEIEALKEEIK